MTKEALNQVRKRLIFIGMAVLAAMLATTAMAEALPPVETGPSGSGYQPAFPGQTRAPGMRTETAYAVDILTDALRSPWGVDVLPDGRLVISEKGGSMRIYDAELGLSAPITGFPAVADAGQGGLLDLKAASDFAETRRLYFTFSMAAEGGAVTALGRGRLSDDDSHLEDAEVLFQALPATGGGGHFGSRLVFDGQGGLYMSTGDRQHSATRMNVQSLQTYWGKVLQLNMDGQPMPNNAWSEGQEAWAGIVSAGHRNVQGLAIHPVTGQLWAGEMGPRGGDELNLIEPGKNYGWPTITYGTEYSGAPVGEGITQQAGLEQPNYYWDPVPAISGMTFYAADVIPEWQNNLFIGGLAGSHIIRLKLEGASVVGEERLLAGEGQRFRDLAAAPDGALYAVTDQGRLYRLQAE